MDEKEERTESFGPQKEDDDYVAVKALKQYELVQKLGHSPWAVVWRAMSKKTRKPVVVKKLYNALETPKRAQMAYREISILERLVGNQHIVELTHVFQATSNKDDLDVFLVFEAWDADLFAAIRNNVLESKHHPFILAQLLRALNQVHSLGFVHRDVKPSNILINSKCHVKLCDFGHARSLVGMDAPISHNNVAGSNTTDYTGSRWYRAPESLLGAWRISQAVDLWGAGCVLGEMLLRRPLFPGTDTSHQLQLILELTGFPSVEEMEEIRATNIEEQLGPTVIGKVTPKAISTMFPKVSAEALDLMRLFLQFSPSARIDVLNALKHPYVVEFYHENFELSNRLSSQDPLFLDDCIVHTTLEYRHLIQENVAAREKALRNKANSTHARYGYNYAE